MIVIVGSDDDPDGPTYITDAAAVVCDRSGGVRICRDGKPNEYLESGKSLVVVP